jgi:DNA (cytosine-5)-methyltransferase 1
MDIITAGIPCQPFSSASNTQLGFEDPRSNVFWKFSEIVKYHQPNFFLIENVKNLITHDSGKSIAKITDNLKTLGYYIKYSLLDTSVITEIPQHRERVFIVGFKNQQQFEKFKFPESTTTKLHVRDLIDLQVPDKYYYTPKLKVWETINSSITKTIDTDTLYQYRRTVVRENKSGLCPTLTANCGGGGHNVPLLKDSKGIRKLTPRECFKFQGFPEIYKIDGLSDTALYKLAGNAITVPVVKKIAEQILECL